MSSNNPKDITPASSGFLHDVALRVKLILRLMGDRRVSPILKLIPIGALGYILWPIDIPGPIDDAAIAWMGAFMFVELCPPDVVQEHLDRLRKSPSIDWASTNPGGEVVDAEFRETGESRTKTEETEQ